MIYLDTNVLIYNIVKQDEKKMILSRDLILKTNRANELLISPLTLQELVFSLTRFKIDKEVIIDSLESFKHYCNYFIDRDLISNAVGLCHKLNFLNMIYDCTHLKFAEKYCNKLITFDKDFEKFRPHTKLEIEILN